MEFISQCSQSVPSYNQPSNQLQTTREKIIDIQSIIKISTIYESYLPMKIDAVFPELLIITC